MTDPKETARDLVVLKILADRVKASNETTKGTALSGMDAGDRTTAKLPDGTVVGAVTVARGRLAPKLVDDAEFLAWVREHAPTEVVTVERVRESYVAKMLAHVKDTGEVIPGIELAEGDPYVVVKPVSGAAEAVARAWAEGTLPLPAVMRPALPEGDA